MSNIAISRSCLQVICCQAAAYIITKPSMHLACRRLIFKTASGNNTYGGSTVEKILLQIALILIATKLLGALSRKIKMPEVLGALAAGVLIGPTVLHFVDYTDNIKLLSELGVITLMFLAGLETNLDEMKKAGLSAFAIACGGIALPFMLGTLCANLFNPNLIESVYIGVILTATSISITAETLNEMGKLNTRAGINILGAAVIDDILGLIIISITLALSGTKSAERASLPVTLISIAVFCVVSFLVIAFLPRFAKKYVDKLKPSPALLSLTLALVLLCAFAAESLSIAAITGSYLCGLLLSQFGHREWLERNVKAISSGFLAPIFFASVGIQANLKGISPDNIFFIIVIFVIAVIGKVFGCGAPAGFFKMKKSEALQIGVGMVSRGEVAIITANIGLQNGIISNGMFTSIILVVILTTIITPVLLKFSFSRKIEKRLG